MMSLHLAMRWEAAHAENSPQVYHVSPLSATFKCLHLLPCWQSNISMLMQAGSSLVSTGETIPPNAIGLAILSKQSII